MRDWSGVHPASLAGVSRSNRKLVCHVWHITHAAYPGIVPPRSFMKIGSIVFRNDSTSPARGAGAVRGGAPAALGCCACSSGTGGETLTQSVSTNAERAIAIHFMALLLLR